MAELLVGMGMGMIVLAGLSMVIITTLHGNARVDARVEATDNARLAMTRIIEELHSGCILPKVSPIQENSSGERLIFWHDIENGKQEVDPKPVKSEIVYSPSAKTLSQVNQKAATGTEPANWTWGAPEPAQVMVSNVGPAAAGKPIFTYYKYASGTLSEKLATPLSQSNASATILVTVELKASPHSEPVRDAGAAATIKNSATFRLTPPSYYNLNEAAPCQ